MSTVFVSTPNIVHEANCPNKTKTLNEAESKSRVTVCGVKSCPRLRICPPKLKKILVFVFSKFIFSFTKKFALSRDTVLSFVGGLSAVEKLFRWVQIVRVTFVSKLLVTPSYKTYACKYLHLYPTLLTKFNSTNVKNLQYSICIIADVVQRSFF